MRIVFQGDATPAQIGTAVKEMLENTLEKAEVKAKRYPIHNPVLEFNLNIQGMEEPQLLIDEDRNHMLTLHTGIEKGELTEYQEVDRTELLEKFDEVVEGAIEDTEDDSETIELEPSDES